MSSVSLKLTSAGKMMGKMRTIKDMFGAVYFFSVLAISEDGFKISYRPVAPSAAGSR